MKNKVRLIDSVVLTAILEALNKKNTKIFKELYIFTNSSRFRNGTEKENGYWPQHGAWFVGIYARYEKNYNSNLSHENLFREEQKFMLTSSEIENAKKFYIESENDYIEQQIPMEKQLTLASRIYEYAMQIEMDTQDAKTAILNVLRAYNVDEAECSYIEGLDSYSAVIEYVISAAKAAKGKPLFKDIPSLGERIRNAGQEDILNIWQKNIVYQHLHAGDFLTVENFNQLIELIWDTDLFVYEQGICSVQNAKKLLPPLFLSEEDCMFNFNNLFICRDRRSQEIVALLLYKKGPLNWVTTPLIDMSKRLDAVLHKDAKNVERYLCEMTAEKYFSLYNNANDNTVSIINLSLNKTWQQENSRSGGRIFEDILTEFFKYHGKDTCELFVLEKEQLEFMTYFRKNLGFTFVGKDNGFSINSQDLPRYQFRRLPQPQS